MNKLLILVCAMLSGLAFGQTCNIEQNGIFELNALGSPEVFFYTAPDHIQNPNADAYDYSWEFTHENGNMIFSNDRSPIFPVACTNRVTVAKVTIYNGTCSKVIHREFKPKVCGTANIFN